MVTDEMVEKACVAYWGDKNMTSMFKGKTREGIAKSMRAALEAALSAAELWPFERQNYNCPCIHPSQCDESCVKNTAPSVAVKALEWEVHGEGWCGCGSIIYDVYPVAEGEGWWAALSMAGYLPFRERCKSSEEAKAAAQADYETRIRSALSAQVQDVAGTVEAFDRDHPELYWHIAKGKITAGEPLYGVIITDIRGNELGDGESNVSAIDAFNIAVDDAALPAAPAKQEGGTNE